jgi:hypothetical protein
MTPTLDFTGRILKLALTNQLSIRRGYLTHGPDFAQLGSGGYFRMTNPLAIHRHLGISLVTNPTIRSLPDTSERPAPSAPHFGSALRQLSTIRRYAHGNHHPYLGLSVVVGTTTVVVCVD